MTAPQQIERVALVELHEHPRNARRHDVPVIARSLEGLGQYRPIVVNRGTYTGRPNEILAGHGTVKAAAALAWPTIDCAFVDVDETTATNILLVDNRASDLAEYDDRLLVELLSTLDDLALTGYDPDDYDELVRGLQEFDPNVLDVDEGDDDLDETAPVPFSDDLIVQSAYEFWREQRFPYPTTARHEALQQINKLARTRTESLRNTNTAYGVPDRYHPNRFDVEIPGKIPPVEAFKSDEKLLHVMELLVESATPITASSVRSVLGYVRGAQCAANFRPGFALLLLRTYAPENGIWLDTSAGFGGRLVAFAASQLSRYIGIDPSSQSNIGNHAMARDLLIDDRVTLIQQPAEDVSVRELGGGESCDFAFTSPPYFGKERYTDEPDQSFKRYPTGESWRDGFLLPTMQLQFAALKPGAVSVVNIADVTIKNETYPLVHWATSCAKAAGFEHERTDEFPLPRVPGQGEASERFEPVLIFRKPRG
jgi:hypothetical protein